MKSHSPANPESKNMAGVVLFTISIGCYLGYKEIVWKGDRDPINENSNSPNSKAYLGHKSSQFMDYNEFKQLAQFPRCVGLAPSDSKLWCPFSSINRNESLLIFISHSWLRGHPEAVGYDSSPHPDNANHDKLKLCIKGIGLIWKYMAPRMKKCYVWMDYSCMPQTEDGIKLTLTHFSKIVEACDAIFTPIVDLNRSWVLKPYGNPYEFYQAPLWKIGPHAYLNRAWCRVEMMYASSISVLDNDESSNVRRDVLFEAGLAHHFKQDRRPHFVYGHGEYEKENTMPMVLPPLQRDYFDQYHPIKGSVTYFQDYARIQSLIDELTPHMTKTVKHDTYEGEYNSQGMRHGRGTCQFADGSLYQGEWRDDLMEGQGSFVFVNGGVYLGQWKNDRRHGRGSYRFADGGEYEGEWKNDFKHGKGVYRFLTGAVYEGDFNNDLREGRGVFRYINGDVYEGEYKNDLCEGKGVLRFKSGAMYEGEFKNGLMEGEGVHRFANGAVLKGKWSRNTPVGTGVLTDPDGNVQLKFF